MVEQDGLRQDRNPHQTGCRCEDPRCTARVRDPRQPRVMRMSVDVAQLRQMQSFDPADAAALGAAAYRVAAQGHVRIRDPEQERQQLPEFLEIDAPGRTLFVSTQGMRDVWELTAELGELMAEQDRPENRKRWQAYRDSKHRDIVTEHRQYNEALLRYGRSHARTGRFKESRI
jgi:hypothetical protein